MNHWEVRMIKMNRNQFIVKSTSLLCTLLMAVACCSCHPGTTGSSSLNGAESTNNSSIENGSEAGTEESNAVDSTDASGDNIASESGNITGSSQSGTTTSKASSSSGKTSSSAASRIVEDNRNLGGRVIKYGCSWSPWWESDPEGIAAKAAFEKKHNCTVKYVSMTSNEDYNTLLSSIMAGNPTVDWFNSTGERTMYWIKKGSIAPLNNYKEINLSDKSIWVNTITKYYTANNKSYGAWAGKNASLREVLLYNKNLIKGTDDLYTLQKNGKLTWDKLFEIAKKVTSGSVYGITSLMSQSDLLRVMVAANGGLVYTRKDNTLNFQYTYDSPNTRYALNTCHSWFTSKVILPTVGTDYLYPQKQFVKGFVGMMVADDWNVSYISDKAKFNVGLVLFPSGPNSKNPYYVNQSCAFADYVCATTKNPQDIVFAMNYFGTKMVAVQQSWEERYGDMLDDTNSINSLRTYYDQINKGNYIVDYKSLLDGGDIYTNNLWSSENAILFGDMTPQQYLETYGPLFKVAINELK